ncbi:MAG TPA: S1/P1 nuclease [Candidatus Kapabacteria bacterium]|nr:S1/P1 nuclease [Candidatus Kapabacteria bacterium]
MADAWGPVGHETVAYIAIDNLKPATLAKIKVLLGNNEDLASISNWADSIRQYQPQTASWHFIDLPVRRTLTKSDEQKYCFYGGCVVYRLKKYLNVIKDTTRTVEKRQEALKFIVHFVGDLHQPLHCVNDNDGGGNDKLVRYKNDTINLHALWDKLIEVHTEENARTLATELEKKITAADKKKWQRGDVDDWALESYEIAKSIIYRGLQAGKQNMTGTTLTQAYYNKMRPIVDAQLEKAGVRLAMLLEDAFK